MFVHALIIARKDIGILLWRETGLVQSILLGLLIVFVFSFSQKPGDVVSAQIAATIFCIATVFCQILVTNALFALEENSGIKIVLLLSLDDIHSLIFGKFLAAYCMLLLAQCFLLPSLILFLNQVVFSYSSLLFGIILLNSGILALGILLASVTQASSAKDSIMTILIFPLLIPLLLSALRIIENSFSVIAFDISSWVGLAIMYDCIFISLTLFFFPFVYSFK
ncbi:MAG: heme exporter protein CcmB [Desulfovibrionaceae bacterium]